MADLLSVSFTAARDLDDGGREVIINVLTVHVPPADRYITGGAIGGDARMHVRERTRGSARAGAHT